ncbi:oxidoreductase [Actinotalea ferrariae CF5-4]|uniref:Oxidoreductase n=1 Tax=Actinotalea ferrariae CF5-4 TaxID=948458 RepID=A0A021VLH2_9CELL|nr:OsmC family protein [Actinotalea ferrariae]EYR62031.1 oxidoreductase [Actinotalea ferrariae CF5-4]
MTTPENLTGPTHASAATDATDPTTDAPSARRTVDIDRTGPSTYLARNARGGELRVSATGDADFTPVELLLVALGACSAVDVDTVTARRVEPDRFTVRVEGDKVRLNGGNMLTDLVVSFDVRFPEGPEGDAARDVLPRALRISHERSCTVSRTVEAGTPVAMRLVEPS